MSEKPTTVNESSIVDLKAEMYKKEMEAQLKGIGKATENIIHKKSKTLQKIAQNTGRFKEKVSNETKQKMIINEEESRKLKEISEKLNAKSILYEKLKTDAIKGVKHENLDEVGILVDFDKKASEQQVNEPSFYDVVQTAEAIHREKMNLKWEEERKKLDEKPIGQEHYQDVLFNELRQHGVGYYQFSSDEIERAKQMEHLKALREETLTTRQKNLEIKAKRDKKIKERLEKIRARKGLSPIKESEEGQDIPKKYIPISVEDQIENIIEKSRVDELFKNMARKIEAQTAPQEDERDFEFAPPTDYSKSKKPKYSGR